MTNRTSPISRLIGLLIAGSLGSLLVTAHASGQSTSSMLDRNDGSIGPSPVGPQEGQPVGGGNYDYFTASLSPGLSAYLTLLTNRHASEHTWALFWAGKYNEALGDCEYSLQRFPNHPRALNLVAEIGKATNQLSLPIGYFENALSLYPQYAFTHAQYGHFLIEIGTVPAGVQQLREALRLDPNQFQAKAWLAEALAAHPELARADGASEPADRAPAPDTGGAKGSR